MVLSTGVLGLSLCLWLDGGPGDMVNLVKVVR